MIDTDKISSADERYRRISNKAMKDMANAIRDPFNLTEEHMQQAVAIAAMFTLQHAAHTLHFVTGKPGDAAKMLRKLAADIEAHSPAPGTDLR
jgi:selenophosphate synthase